MIVPRMSRRPPRAYPPSSAPPPPVIRDDRPGKAREPRQGIPPVHAQLSNGRWKPERQPAERQHGEDGARRVSPVAEERGGEFRESGPPEEEADEHGPARRR